jgi:hypothetical protein
MASTSTMNSIVQLGVGLISTPADGTVSTAKLEDGAVTGAKVNSTFDVSAKTVTLPASVSGLGTGITNAQLAGSIDVTSKITGVVPTANLGSGSASSSTYLAGDQTYKEVVAIDIAWQSVVTGATLTAVAGRGYPINTTSNACTVTLPASASVGDQIIFSDYLRTWGTNAVTINQNSLKYQGNATPNPLYDTDGESVHIVYMDATQGWVPINDGAVAMETPQTYSIDFLVVAGGAGGGGCDHGGGGGAGGYRTLTQAGFSAGGGTITVTVGPGGAGGTNSPSRGVSGTDSSITGGGVTTITSAGGGGGGGNKADSEVDGNDGGSGGGGSGKASTGNGTGGSGNTPITSPSQGYAGGDGNYGYGSPYPTGGGGGAGAVGAAASGANAGNGGAGTANEITGSSVFYAGGGGGSKYTSGTQGAGGTGGGGAGQFEAVGTAGTANTGGGGGGSSGMQPGSVSTGGLGGSGVVIMRMLTADFGSVTGAPTESTDGLYKVLEFTGDGTYVI